MRKAKLPVVKRKIVIAPDAYNMGGRRFGEPQIRVIKHFLVPRLKAAEVATVNEQITWWNGDLPVTFVCVCDYADREH